MRLNLRMSHHFIQNWSRRVGTVPTPETVSAVLADSVRVQTGKRFSLRDGSVASTLSWYWHPELSLLISLDPVRRKMVSVLTADLVRQKRGDTNGY